MAAGSSLPEVFSSFVALANPNTDNTLGMDTIVGSSVYNTLVIVGVSAIAGPIPAPFHAFPLGFYAICLLFISVLNRTFFYTGGDMYLDWKPLCTSHAVPDHFPWNDLTLVLLQWHKGSICRLLTQALPYHRSHHRPRHRLLLHHNYLHGAFLKPSQRSRPKIRRPRR